MNSKRHRSVQIKEITTSKLNPKAFIDHQIASIKEKVGDGCAISALSGGVDSSTVTMLAYKALGNRLRTYFIDNGLMREDEPEEVVSTFQNLEIPVKLIKAKTTFFKALKGVADPEEKREAITQTFYRDVFGRLVQESGAINLLQGTILTDVEETVDGIKRQHNILTQLGVDTEKEFGYQVIEPLVQLRKDGVRKIAQALGLPESIYDRMPFPGPALVTRVIGEVTPKKIATVRVATVIVEEELARTKAFQYMAILHEDRVTGVRDGKRVFGQQVEIRCWDSVDARIARPTDISMKTLFKLAKKITTEIPEVVSVTYNITSKPPSTMEAV